MIKGISIFVAGVIIDIISTLIGINQGLVEGNPIGVKGVVALNIIVLIVVFLMRKSFINKAFNKYFFIVGSAKILWGLWNFFLITRIIKGG